MTSTTYHDTTSVVCTINGVNRTLEGRPEEPLSLVLRRYGLFSVRESCSIGVCGTCTVLVDGQPVSTCIMPLYAADGCEVSTAEGLASDGELSPLQQAFIDKQAFQCSFCTPGFLMSATALLDHDDRSVTDEALEQGLQGHLCRCGCYEHIKDAVRSCMVAQAE